MKVLIVDDEKYIREALASLIHGQGHSADTAENGEQALRKLTEEVYDVVVSDVKMPLMDGFALLKEVKSTHPDVAVVMMTGFSQNYSVREAIAQGAEEYLVKPFRSDEVLLTVERAYERSRLKRSHAEAGNV